MKRKVKIGSLALLLVSVWLAGDAKALPVTGALSGWGPNSISFVNTYDGRTLTGQIDYAVYDNYPGTAPAPGQYVYAYQVSNSDLSDVSVDSFSVGIPSGAVVGDIGADNYGLTGGVDPSFAYFSPDAQTPQSAMFLFMPSPFGGLVPGGQQSTILLFSSDKAPTTGYGMIEGGSLGQMIGNLPTPSAMPEPATVFLLGAGGALISVTRKRRSA